MPVAIAEKLVIMSPTHGCEPRKNAWSGLRSTHGFLWRPYPCNACQDRRARGMSAAGERPCTLASQPRCFKT